MRILVVDDDPAGMRMLQFLLGEEGYEVELADSPRAALALMERHTPDLLLLDVGLPQQNGFDLYRKLRDLEYDIPVIFVTARGELDDRLHGLRMGADDYIAKPYQPAELIARVEAVLRRYRKTGALATPVMRMAGVEINTADLRVTLPDQRNVYLTPTELKVLLQLVQRAGQVVSRDALMSSVWGERYDGESNIVDVYIRRLRRKLERDAARPRFIQATRGLGYRFVNRADAGAQDHP
ncbi:MAG TPA: response regulator transcription factor [Ktedonobacterales bacterium]|nr:response regulator transcription factor [Ktedonobacterales bacterium]